MPSWIALLLKIAIMVLQEVWNDIEQQQNRIQNDGIQITQRYMNMLGSPDFWDGEDADAMKNEFVRTIIPNMEKITGVTRRTNDGLREALNIVTNADRQVSQMVSNLASEFASIY